MQNAMFKYPSDIFERDWSVIACALQVILFPSKNNTLRVSQKRKKNQTKKKTICIIFPQLAMFLLNKRKKIFSDNKITKNIT